MSIVGPRSESQKKVKVKFIKMTLFSGAGRSIFPLYVTGTGSSNFSSIGGNLAEIEAL